MNDFQQTITTIRRCRLTAQAVGFVGGLLLVIGSVVNPGQFARSYLFGYLFWLQIPLGCLAAALLYELVGGSWGRLLGPLMIPAAATVPLFAVLFVPIGLSMDQLYVWHATSDVITDEKRLYLNQTAFFARSGGYFAVWSVWSWLAVRWSARAIPNNSPSRIDRRMRTAAVGLILFVLSASFAAIDWLMSLEPNWFSSIYGGLFVVGAVLTAWCFVTAIAGICPTAQRAAMRNPRKAFQDTGNLLLAFLLVWMYFAYSQFLIIWSGDLPEETAWYRDRLTGGWQWLVPVIAVGHFAIPFLLLLSREVKRRPEFLAAVAGGLLLMRCIDLYWSIMPAFSPGRLQPHWLDVVAPAAVGGIWLSFYLHLLLGRLEREPSIEVRP